MWYFLCFTFCSVAKVDGNYCTFRNLVGVSVKLPLMMLTSWEGMNLWSLPTENSREMLGTYYGACLGSFGHICFGRWEAAYRSADPSDTRTAMRIVGNKKVRGGRLDESLKGGGPTMLCLVSMKSS